MTAYWYERVWLAKYGVRGYFGETPYMKDKLVSKNRSDYTIADIMAEQQTDQRGDCPRCDRPNVPIGKDDICFPCGIKEIQNNPALSRAIDIAAEKKMRAMIGESDKEPKN